MTNQHVERIHLPRNSHIVEFCTLYFDLLLDPIETLRFEDHLEECEDCQEAVAQCEHDRMQCYGLKGLFGEGAPSEISGCFCEATLEEYLDDQLTLEERQLVDDHIDACYDCGMHLEYLAEQRAASKHDVVSNYVAAQDVAKVLRDSDPAARDLPLTIFRNDYAWIRLIYGANRVVFEQPSLFLGPEEPGEEPSLIGSTIYLKDDLGVELAASRSGAELRLVIIFKAQPEQLVGMKIVLTPLDSEAEPMIALVTDPSSASASIGGVRPGKYRLALVQDSFPVGSIEFEIALQDD